MAATVPGPVTVTVTKVDDVIVADCNTDDAMKQNLLVSDLKQAMIAGSTNYAIAIFVTAVLKGGREFENYMRVLHNIARRFPEMKVAVHIVKDSGWEFVEKNRVKDDEVAYGRMSDRWSLSAFLAENVTEHYHSVGTVVFDVTDMVFIDAPFPLVIMESIRLGPHALVVIGDGYNTRTRLPSEGGIPETGGRWWQWSAQEQDVRYKRLLEWAPADRHVIFNGFVASHGDTRVTNAGKFGPEPIALAIEETGTNAPRELVQFVARPASEGFLRNQLFAAFRNAGLNGSPFNHSYDGVRQFADDESVFDTLTEIAAANLDVAIDISHQLFAASYAATQEAYHASGSNAPSAVEAALRGETEVEMSDPMVGHAAALVRENPHKYTRRAKFDVASGPSGQLVLSDDGPLRVIYIEDALEQQANLLVKLTEIDAFLTS